MYHQQNTHSSGGWTKFNPGMGQSWRKLYLPMGKLWDEEGAWRCWLLTLTLRPAAFCEVWLLSKYFWSPHKRRNGFPTPVLCWGFRKANNNSIGLWKEARWGAFKNVSEVKHGLSEESLSLLLFTSLGRWVNILIHASLLPESKRNQCGDFVNNPSIFLHHVVPNFTCFPVVTKIGSFW